MGSKEVRNMKKEIEYLSRLISVHKEKQKMQTRQRRSIQAYQRTYQYLQSKKTANVMRAKVTPLKRKHQNRSLKRITEIVSTNVSKTSGLNPYKLDRTHSKTFNLKPPDRKCETNATQPQQNPFSVTKVNTCSGRTLSKNKYKLINCAKQVRLSDKLSPKSVASIMQEPKIATVNLKHKLIRSSQAKMLRLKQQPYWCSAAAKQHNWFCPKPKLKPSSKMVLIGGLLYKASKNKLSRANATPRRVKHKAPSSLPGTLIIRGVRFQMDRSGMTLKRAPQTPVQLAKGTTSSYASPSLMMKRIDVGGRTYIERQPGVFVKTNNSRCFVNRAVNRSIRMLTVDQKRLKKVSSSSTKQYCMFYNRFGRCNKGAKCPYVHDPDKVAVCTRFLRQTCKVENCPFSHRICPEKMPACSFFLQGRCNSDDCPYQHVKVSSEAEVCMDFVKGYCPSGKQCRKMHLFVCPEFSRSGKCPKGRQCPLIHRLRKQKMQPPSDVSAATSAISNPGPEHAAFSKVSSDEGSQTQLPSYISLVETNDSKQKDEEIRGAKAAPSLRIRPLFLTQPS